MYMVTLGLRRDLDLYESETLFLTKIRHKVVGSPKRFLCI